MNNKLPPIYLRKKEYIMCIMQPAVITTSNKKDELVKQYEYTVLRLIDAVNDEESQCFIAYLRAESQELYDALKLIS